MTPPRPKTPVDAGPMIDEMDQMKAEIREATTSELASVGIVVGTVYDDVWHDGQYVGKVKLISIGTVLGEPVLTFQVEGTGTYYLIRWAAIGRLKRVVK